jgi:hypothetical protein
MIRHPSPSIEFVWLFLIACNFPTVFFARRVGVGARISSFDRLQCLDDIQAQQFGRRSVDSEGAKCRTQCNDNHEGDKCADDRHHKDVQIALVVG